MSNIDTQISSALGITSKEIVKQIIDPKPVLQAIVPRPEGILKMLMLTISIAEKTFTA